MSKRTDDLVALCVALHDDEPSARRCLSAMRRSGRDINFDAHIGARRLVIIAAKAAFPILDFIADLL